MDLSTLDVEVLNFIAKNKCGKDAIVKKYGEMATESLKSLYDNNYIESSHGSDGIHFGFADYEQITITQKGWRFLYNCKKDKKFSNRKAWLDRAIGFVAAIITGVLVHYIPIWIDFLIKWFSENSVTP